MKTGWILLAASLATTLGWGAVPPAKKAPIRGLTSMGLTGFNTPGVRRPVDNAMLELTVHPGVYRGAVINTTWKLVEPAPGQYDFSSIETGMTAIRAYNKAHPATPVVAKLRVWPGTTIPEWLGPASGGVLKFVGPHGAVEVGRWWTPTYRTAWAKLNAAMAAKYDGDPLVGEIGAASCATLTDESFIYPANVKIVELLHAAGFNDALERSCLLGVVDDYAPWKLTPVDLTFSPSPHTDDGAKAAADDVLPLEVMKLWRAKRGELGVISNHSVQDPIAAHLQPIWADLTAVGQPLEGQTASQGVIQHGKEVNGQIGDAQPKGAPPIMDWNRVIQNALDHHCNELEIWPTVEGGGRAQISFAMLKAWADKLR